MLVPYFGARMLDHIPDSSCRWYGCDNPDQYQEYLESTDIDSILEKYRVDGDWNYQFNSLGYRGEEFNPDTDYRTFFVGCSLTFGVGVPWEQTWGYLFSQHISKLLNKRVPNCLNFASGGESNDYILRTAMMQCQSVKPDLLVAFFTFFCRKELVLEDKVEIFGPWNANCDDVRRGFLEWYSDEEGIINGLKNLLLLQYYCKSASIPLLFGLREIDKLKEKRFREHPIIGKLITLIDKKYIFDFSLTFHDKGRDLTHPGPKSHEIFANRLLEFYQERFLE